MRLITIAGPPSSGKTSVLIKSAILLREKKLQVGIVKFDCLSTFDNEEYEKNGFACKVGLAGALCPDHYFVTNIEDCVAWGKENKFDYLICESAGLCNRCSPHIREFLSVCVIDNLSGINTPAKIGPMLKFADVVVITKGDIVSQAEREVFYFKVRQSNPQAAILSVNGISGQGIANFSEFLLQAKEVENLYGTRLRFSVPMSVCSYCLGEKRIGKDFQHGNIKKMQI